MALNILQILLLVFGPALILWAEKRNKVVDMLGAVVVCYIFGIILGNLGFWKLNPKVTKEIVELSVPLSIPMLLFSTDFIKWLRLAKSTVVSFILMIIVVLIVAFAGGYLFKDTMSDFWQIAGMLVGVYTGGTANMSAIGVALGVGSEAFVMMNAVDIIIGGGYFFLCLSIVPKILAKFLPAFQSKGEQPTDICEEGIAQSIRDRFLGYVAALFLSGAILGASVGISILLKGKMAANIIILSLTTIAIGASFFKQARNIEAAFPFGQYILLIFCVGVGSMADISKFNLQSMNYFWITLFVLSFSILGHFLLCKLFKIDRDTAMITSTAGIYGPAFIGPMASALKNREVVVSGLTTSLVGIAVGNYFGIVLAELLKKLFLQ